MNWIYELNWSTAFVCSMLTMFRMWLAFQATHVWLWYDIEKHSICEWDVLKIGSSGAQCQLCGQSNGVLDLGIMRGNIDIYFKSDSSVEKRGFILWYQKEYTAHCE